MIRMLTATYGGVGELHADVGDRRAERAHRERHDVHRAALHRAAEQVRRASRASRPGRASCWSGRRRTRCSRADEGAVLDARDVAGVRARQVGVRPLGVGERLERALLDQLPAEGVVLLRRPVAPVDRARLRQRRDLLDPGLQPRVARSALPAALLRCSHSNCIRLLISSCRCLAILPHRRPLSLADAGSARRGACGISTARRNVATSSLRWL